MRMYGPRRPDRSRLRLTGLIALLCGALLPVRAFAAKAAMQGGKHVYVQKPLTYSVHEARMLRELADGDDRQERAVLHDLDQLIADQGDS